MKKTVTLIMCALFAYFLTLPKMAYSENSDLIESVDERQVMQLVDDDNTKIITIAGLEAAMADAGHEFHAEAGLMNQRIERARTDADELIDSFVRTQYELPLPATPGLINMLSVDLTYVNLYERRYRGQLPDGLQSLYNRSMEKLKLIQAGKMNLQDEPDVAGGQIAVKASGKVFTDGYLSRF